MDIDARLSELGLTLPDAPATAANYVPFTRAGEQVWISGQVSIAEDGAFITGQVDSDLSIEDGAESGSELSAPRRRDPNGSKAAFRSSATARPARRGLPRPCRRQPASGGGIRLGDRKRNGRASLFQMANLSAEFSASLKGAGLFSHRLPPHPAVDARPGSSTTMDGLRPFPPETTIPEYVDALVRCSRFRE